MPKYYCTYCDVHLTHDSVSVRKAHNAGRNHLSNVRDWYAALGHEHAQAVMDEITRLYDTNPSGPMVGRPPNIPPPPHLRAQIMGNGMAPPPPPLLRPNGVLAPGNHPPPPPPPAAIGFNRSAAFPPPPPPPIFPGGAVNTGSIAGNGSQIPQYPPPLPMSGGNWSNGSTTVGPSFTPAQAPPPLPLAPLGEQGGVHPSRLAMMQR